MGDFVYNSNEFDYMLTTEGRVIPEMGIIMHYNCFYNMKERSCKLRSVGGTSYSYDKNGNIESISRMGDINPESTGLIDDLTLGYNGNQLKYANESSETNSALQENGFTDNGSSLTTNEYLYDHNGNMTVDLNKQIENIDYNYLNLPDKITVYTDSYDYLAYVYDASGTKLRKVVTDGLDVTTTDYTGSFVFTDNELAFIITPEGRAIPDSSGNFTYQYYLKDHLGNTRVTYTQKGDVLQDNNYYPFGLSTGEATNYFANACLENKYLYNGKELDDDLGVGWYDYGARFYDPQLARWHSVDPLAENHYDFTPYNYVLNNPMLFIDPFGMDTTVYVLDQANNPDNKRVYTADVYVDVDGKINGPYEGSSYPNDDSKHNTLDDGEYDYNNESGHKGGTQKGLNIVNADGERKADGTDPEGNDVEMTVVNVHSGVKPEDDPSGLNRQNRGSAGCPTIKPSDAKAFFKNFNWNTGAGQNSNKGTSKGKIRISRDQTYNTNKTKYLEMIKRTQLNKGI